MSSMLPMFAICNSSRIFSRRAFSSGVRFFLAICKTSCAVLLFYTTQEVYTNFGIVSDKKYPKISQSWRSNWANLSTYFQYPQEVQRLIYTTNAIEGFNRQLRKVTKAKSVFPTDDSLLKMLYLAMMDITKKWTGRRQDWSLIHAQMAIYFAERMPE